MIPNARILQDWLKTTVSARATTREGTACVLRL
jgi:hypothetical protein